MGVLRRLVAAPNPGRPGKPGPSASTGPYRPSLPSRPSLASFPRRRESILLSAVRCVVRTMDSRLRGNDAIGAGNGGNVGGKGLGPGLRRDDGCWVAIGFCCCAAPYLLPLPRI